MTLAQLNAKIAKLPFYSAYDHSPRTEGLDRDEARYLRDERLAVLGVAAGQEPTEAQIAIVHAQLFGEEAQRELL